MLLALNIFFILLLKKWILKISQASGFCDQVFIRESGIQTFNVYCHILTLTWWTVPLWTNIDPLINSNSKTVKCFFRILLLRLVLTAESVPTSPSGRTSSSRTGSASRGAPFWGVRTSSRTVGWKAASWDGGVRLDDGWERVFKKSKNRSNQFKV